MNIYKRYFKKYKFSFIIAVSCVFFEAVCDLLQPAIMARIIDQGVKNNDLETVIDLGLLMLLITALGAGFATARSILSTKVSQSFGSDLRKEMFEKVINLSENSADRFASGSLITRMTNDIAHMVHFINGLMRIFLKAPLHGVGSIIFAVVLSPQLSLVMFLVVAIITIFIVFSMKMSYVRFSKVQYAIDKVNTVVQEYLMGIRLVKAFGSYENEKEKFEGVNADLYTKSVSSQLLLII